MAIEHIRLSEQARDQLIKLKRYTGIKNWNTLCRWGFCLSIADPSRPAQVRIPAASSVEMTWKVFGGRWHEIYLSLLKQRCLEDGFDPSEEVLDEQFRLHLHRGIAHLSADRSLRSISALAIKAIAPVAASGA